MLECLFLSLCISEPPSPRQVCVFIPVVSPAFSDFHCFLLFFCISISTHILPVSSPSRHKLVLLRWSRVPFTQFPSLSLWALFLMGTSLCPMPFALCSLYLFNTYLAFICCFLSGKHDRCKEQTNILTMEEPQTCRGVCLYFVLPWLLVSGPFVD